MFMVTEKLLPHENVRKYPKYAIVSQSKNYPNKVGWSPEAKIKE